MKKFFISALIGLAALSTSAANPIDFDQIKHWTGTGPNRAALVIQFNGDKYGSDAYVWGFRWEDGQTVTGEDMFKAICKNSSRLSLLTQYTGSMGATVNGIGYSLNQEVLNHIYFDFEKAKTFEFINFDYFTANSYMGQTEAPGENTPAIAQAAIDESKNGNHYIQHPFDAIKYGYPAYDYDCWLLSKDAANISGSNTVDMKWASAWYEGYWSYWTTSLNNEDWMYSGSGYSGRKLSNGAIDGWSFTQFESPKVGGMGEGIAPCESGATVYMPKRLVDGGVDITKAIRIAGTGDREIPVVISWGDNTKIDNVVYRYKFNDVFPDLATIVKNITESDKALTATVSGNSVSEISFDANGDGLPNSGGSDVTGEGAWTLTEFEDALLISRNAELSPEYLFYLPDKEAEGVWIPENISFNISDNYDFIPVFVQPKAVHDAINYSWYFRSDEEPTHSTNLNTIISSISTSAATYGRITYKGTAIGDVNIHVRARIGKGADYAYSNICKFSLLSPEVPVTGLEFRDSEVDSPLNTTIDNPLTIIPENATYTKLTYSSSNTKVATASATKIATTVNAGEATVSVAYALDPEIKASFNVKSSLVNPVEGINIKGVQGDVIVLNPKRMIGIIGEFTPENADIRDFDVAISGNGTSKDDYIATLYKVNYWDENNTRIQFYELSGHRVGECKLTLTAKDGSGYVREYTVRVEEQDHTPLENGYTDGTIILNEEWFGHTNGGLNYITPEGTMMYQAYERENPGMSFGCTSQYGTIWAGKLLVASKQAVDKGDPLPGGGRLVVADANTLKRIGSIDDLMYGEETKSADGRAIVGATPTKIYVGSSNGIYVVDLNNIAVIGKVHGSESTSDLYSGQIGDMVRAGKYVFAIKQSAGTFVIDIDKDQIIKQFADPTVQGITQSADGNVWVSCIENGCTKFVCINPETLEEVTENTVIMPESIGTVSCSWGAWRTTQFFSSKSKNELWFVTGASGIAGGSSGGYYRWTIGSDPSNLKPVIDINNPRLQASNKRVYQKTYGTSRVDDRSGELIVMTCEDGASGHYRYAWTHFVDTETGEILRTIELEPYYWFQSLPIFPDKYDAEINIENITIDIADETRNIDLTELVTDNDNISYNINISLEQGAAATIEAEATAKASEVKLEGKMLSVKPIARGTDYVTITAESNGKVVSKTISVTVTDKSGVGAITDNPSETIVCDGSQVIFTGANGVTFTMANISGRIITTIKVDSDNYIFRPSSLNGVYVLYGDNGATAKIALSK